MKITEKGKAVKVVIDSTQRLTSNGGWWILERLMCKLGVKGILDFGYDIKVRHRLYSEGDYLISALALLLTGGKVLSDIEKLVSDKTFQSFSSLAPRIPTISALDKFFNAASGRAVARLSSRNLALLKRTLTLLRKRGSNLGKVVYAFMDSSEIEVYGKQFEGAGKNYYGDLALRLHTLFVDEFLVGIQVNSAASHTTFGWKGLLKDFSSIASSLRARVHFLLDAAYYNHRVLQAIESLNQWYSVTCKYSEALREEAEGLAPESWQDDIAELAYKPSGFAEPRRVIVRRYPKTGAQSELFGTYNYSFIMTNRYGLTAKELYEIHGIKAGEENKLKQLLADMGLHHPRFMKLTANRFFAQVAALAFNIIKAAKYIILDGTRYFFISVSSFIYLFVQRAARLVTTNWEHTLKLCEYPLKIEFLESRLR